MSPSGPIQVITDAGLHGTVEAESRSLIGTPDQVAVLLDDGKRMLVPGDLLELREDGTYYLPLDRAQMDASQAQGQGRDNQTIVVPIVEETLDVHKRPVRGQTVRVQKVVHERQEVVDEPVWQEDVEVERVDINQPVDGPVPVRQEGDTLIVPILEEVLVIEKRLILRQEVRITRRRTQVREVRHVTLRGEEALVEHEDGESRAPGEPSEQAPTHQ